MRFLASLWLLLGSPPVNTIAIDHDFQVLHAASPAQQHRQLLRQASAELGGDFFILDGQRIDAALLSSISDRRKGEPLLRVARERMRRPLDVEDFIYLLDDLLLARNRGLDLSAVWIPASRARAAGVFIHPDDVFFGKPRVYGVSRQTLRIDRPKRPHMLSPARDGEVLGPRWCARFRNPSGRRAKLAALRRARPDSDLAQRVASLMRQLKKQGATVLLYSTVRDRRRGYLMWGAYVLAQQRDAAGVDDTVRLLQQRARQWQLDVPIVWRHPQGWRATLEAARSMADAYQVVYATEAGARASNHYRGVAVDLDVFGLPAQVELRAPDGAAKIFDLSAVSETRDLNLSPQMITWVEQHFGLKKLLTDYPHWDDAMSPSPPSTQANSGPGD